MSLEESFPRYLRRQKERKGKTTKKRPRRPCVERFLVTKDVYENLTGFEFGLVES